MFSLLIMILLMGAIFKVSFCFLGIFGRLIGGLLGIVGYILLGILAITVFGIGFIALPVILVIGVLSIVGLIFKAA